MAGTSRCVVMISPYPALREPCRLGATLSHPDLSFPGTHKEENAHGAAKTARQLMTRDFISHTWFSFLGWLLGPWAGRFNCKLVLFSDHRLKPEFHPNHPTKVRLCSQVVRVRKPLPATGEKNDPSNHCVTNRSYAMWSNPASPSSLYKAWLPSGSSFFF